MTSNSFSSDRGEPSELRLKARSLFSHDAGRIIQTSLSSTQKTRPKSQIMIPELFIACCWSVVLYCLVTFYNSRFLPSSSPTTDVAKIAEAVATTNATAIVEKSSYSSYENEKFEFLFYMHIPKAGGRTMQKQLSRWFSYEHSNNCGVRGCCSSWNEFIKQVEDVSANPSCDALSREIRFADILKLRNAISLVASSEKSNVSAPSKNSYDDWYMLSQIRSPIDRYVSAIKHSMRRKRCQHNNLERAIHTALLGNCSNIVMVGYKQAKYFEKGESEETKEWDAVVDLSVLDNFHFIGLTHHMDANFCLLALDLAKYNYKNVTSTWAREEVCQTRTKIFVQSTKPREEELRDEIISTDDVLKILTNEVPRDIKIYVKVLEQYRLRLLQAAEENPSLNLEEDLKSIELELSLWTRVSQTLSLPKETKEKSKKQENAMRELLVTLNNQEKNLLVPSSGVKWS